MPGTGRVRQQRLLKLTDQHVVERGRKCQGKEQTGHQDERTPVFLFDDAIAVPVRRRVVQHACTTRVIDGWPCAGTCPVQTVDPPCPRLVSQYPSFLHHPRIDDVNAAVIKVLRVARSKACSSRTGHCDNHGIELADGFPRRSSRGGDFRVHVRSIAVET